MQLGVIADDFTGATDIASFLVENGMATIQLNGVPSGSIASSADAVVISLKSRSCPATQAVADSLAALEWLRAQGCQQFYFKYCSTFDSTGKGNIGPVTDALLAALGESQTVISPALPVNGRTVYQGHLFVMHQLLSESGMRHHPVTPMLDSSLLRLMDAQAKGRSGLVPFNVMEQGSEAVKQQLAELKAQGVSYAVLDTLNEQHLLTQGAALTDMKLLTGGSGLAIGVARQWAKRANKNVAQQKQHAQAAGYPQGTRCVVLSGSCSVMTNRQVARYRQQASAMAIDIERCLTEPDAYAQSLCQWVEQQQGQPLAPLLYATSAPEQLQAIQSKWGAERSSSAVEKLFAALVTRLNAQGYRRFIVAGGETSGVVAQTLGVGAFYIGPVISPGVPWVKSTDGAFSLALKSGNFGDENFFARAQEAFPV